MDINNNWEQVKNLLKHSFRSSLHFSIATVNEKGEPHVTPIGSLIAGKPGQAIYFEEFTSSLPRNLKTNNKVCVLAVNSSKWFWLKSLLTGHFNSPPAVRLRGVAGEVRAATEVEIRLWQKRVKPISFSKGHAYLWSTMGMVREISFSSIEPVQIGAMTAGNWK